MKRALRIGGTVLAAAGLLAAAWAFTVWRWQDPFTALYTSHAQESLEREYRREAARYRAPVPIEKEAPVAVEQRRIHRAATRYRG